jgi:hypothetical protein
VALLLSTGLETETLVKLSALLTRSDTHNLTTAGCKARVETRSAPEKSLVALSTCTCSSSPITVSHPAAGPAEVEAVATPRVVTVHVRNAWCTVDRAARHTVPISPHRCSGPILHYTLGCVLSG